MILVFVDMPCGNDAADHGQGINVGVRADDTAGIENGIAADIDPVAQDRADLAKTCGCMCPVAVDHDILLVSLDIGSDGAGAHMSMESQYTVADIIVMRDFNLVEKDHVLELCGVAYSRAFSHDGAAADECTLTDSGVLINDAGAADISAVKNSGALCHPDVLSPLLEAVCGKGRTDLPDEIADQGKHFPGISGLCEEFRCDGFVEIKNLLICKICELQSNLLFLCGIIVES